MTNHTEISNNENQSDIFQPIVDSIHEVTGLPVSIWIPDKQKKILRIAASVGLPTSYLKAASINLDQPSVTGDAFLKKRMQKVKDIRSEPRWVYKDQAFEMNWKSAICVPIKVDKVVIGVISVYGYTQRAITDLAYLLPEYANQIAISFEAKYQREVLKQILSIGAKLESMTENLKDVLDEVVRGACDVIGADCAVIYPYDIERKEFYDIENVSKYGLINPLVVKEKPRIKGGMAVYIAKRGEVVLHDISKQDPKMITTSSFIQKEKIKAFYGIALKVSSNVLGVLYVNYRTPHTFTSQEKNTIRLFAQQASIAVSNARLYEQANTRIETLEKLQGVGTALTSITTAPEGLKNSLMLIAQSAQDVLSADLVDIYEYNQGKDEFGLSPIQVGNRYEPYIIKTIQKDDIVRIAIAKGPKYVAKAQEDRTLTQPSKLIRPDAPLERFVVREKLLSTASIPLAVGNELVGILFVNYRSPQTFSKQQRELIELFADQAAIAIYNSRLYQQARQQSEILKRLQGIGIDLVSLTGTSEDLHFILEKIARSAQELLGADLVDFYQYFENLGEYTLPPVQVGERRAPNVKKEHIRKDDVIWSIIKGKQSQYILDSQGDKGLNTSFVENRKDLPKERFVIREEIKSTAAVPLLVGKEVVGALFANYRTSQAFPSEQRSLVELFAAQAAIAIWNARLFSRIKKRLEERLTDISAFQQIYERMYSSNQEELMSLIAEKATLLTGAKYGVLWLLDKDGRQLTCGGVVGDNRPASMLPKLPLDKTSINGWVMQTGKPYLCNNIEGDVHYRSWYDDARSELAVPLIHNKTIIGTLDVESTIINNFSQDHEELLKTLATQATIAIQNAKTVKKLDTLADVGRELTNTMWRQEHQILELIHTQASELMDTNNMYIALYDERTDTVRFGLAYVDGEKIDVDTHPDWQPRKAGKGKTEKIIRTKQPIFHATKKEADDWYEQPGRKEYVGSALPSWIGVPMIVGNKAIGVIATYHPDKEYVYSGDDLDILETMANQAAIALENARLYFGKNRKLEALVNLEQAITSSIEKGEGKIVDLVHEQASELMETNNMYIALYDERTDTVRFGLAYVDGEKIDVDTHPDWQPRKAGKGKTEEIIRTKQPIFHATKKEADDWYKQTGREDYIGISLPSWMGVPMVVGDKAIGVIATYHSEKEYVYSGDDLDILESMANLAAIALDNARLFNEAKDEVVAQKKLASMGSAMAAIEHRINNTLNIIPPNLNRLRKRVDTNDPEIQKILDIIDRNTRYTTQLLKRIQTPLQEVTRADVDLNAIINEIIDLLQEEWTADGPRLRIKTVVKVDKKLPILRLPEGQISEVIHNLIENAYRALKKAYQAEELFNAKLQVSTKLNDDKIFIKVQDNVPGGIAEAVQQRLFIKPVPSKTPGEGSGLGLWLSKLIMASIAGDIRIESTGAQGTTMVVEIPAE